MAVSAIGSLLLRDGNPERLPGLGTPAATALKKKPVLHRARRTAALKPKTTRRRTPASLPPAPAAESRRPVGAWLYPLLALASFVVGTLSGYLAWGRTPPAAKADLRQPAPTAAAEGDRGTGIDLTALMKEVNPPEGYPLPARYGDLGPRLLESGAIDYDAFAAVYVDAGDPLTQSQIGILKSGSDESIVISPENAHFLLNFFWAVGLVNKNPILTEGPITRYSDGRIDSFASTGGWTIGAKPVKELFASTELISLTSEQQARVQEVASAVYRPCCDNPTLFPDCNHGMAMLGLLELMASQGASTAEMFKAAKYVNAYWFPQQALQTAIYLKANQDEDYAQADPRLVSGQAFFSGSGSGRIYASLRSEGLLPKAADNSGSCAN